MNIKAFSMTAQGASHIKKNKECQDASQSYFDDDCAIAVVCDGHGGNDYIRSAYGSKKASEIALKNIKEFIKEIEPNEFKRHSDKKLDDLERCIIAEWGKDVRTHWHENPITSDEESLLSEKAKKRYLQEHKVESAYGTTLIAVAFTKNYWFGIQIGDGKCIVVDTESKIGQAIELDTKCFLNATTSLCDSDALERFHFCFSEILPAAVFIGSDGIDDCFKNDDQLFNFYRTVCYSYGTNEFERAVDELTDFLPRLSQKGSGDDVSIAGILNMDVLPNIDVVKSFNRDEEKKKKEKAEADEAKRNAELKAEYERRAEETKKRKEEEEKRRTELKIQLQQEEEVRKEGKLQQLRLAVSVAKSELSKILEQLYTAKNLKDNAKKKYDEVYEHKPNCTLELKDLQSKSKEYEKLNNQYEKVQKEAENKENDLKKFIKQYGAECSKCHNVMLADVKFCSKCGNNMSIEPEDININDATLKSENESVSSREISDKVSGDSVGDIVEIETTDLCNVQEENHTDDSMVENGQRNEEKNTQHDEIGIDFQLEKNIENTGTEKMEDIKESVSEVETSETIVKDDYREG